MTTTTHSQTHHGVDRTIGMLMGFVAATLAIGSFVHLAGFTPSGAKPPFQADHAGIAELIIGLVLAYGAVIFLRAGTHARTAALATTAFAIVGFLVGLRFTLSGGDVPDVAYHAIMLPILALILIAVVRGAR
jgi:hypothetical protein